MFLVGTTMSYSLSNGINLICGDNLIVAFEMRLYSHFLSTNTSLSLLSRIVPNLFTAPKDSSRRPTGKRRGKGGDKDEDVVAVPEKDKVTSADEMLKAFCVKFVRLNGILFLPEQGILETFSDVLGSTSSSLRDLIWSSLTEDMIFVSIFLISRGSRLELYSHDRSLFPSLNDPVDAEFSLGSDVLL
ncbi:unnamed protein product [Brassica napus]|uniref:(rape) hypothetical protein n=1 Tax=Brassica napus TaxID=3708 RepID=A0A816J5Z7_BRANA|nr:unnamed protein product [Brassica napus]